MIVGGRVVDSVERGEVLKAFLSAHPEPEARPSG